jgi:glucose 1-dehydrogenase
MRYTNKVCLITGAASGIGKATAIRLASEEGKVVVIDRDPAGGKATSDEINNNGHTSIFIQCDVGKEAEIIATVNQVIEKWSTIDVLVNNAAMMTYKKIVDLSSEEWDTVMAVNLRSVFLFCKYCIPHMSHGSIVNISSVHAHETTVNVVPYASSKGAMEAFIRGVSMEYPFPKLRINCIAPGAVDTPMLWNNPNIKSGAEKIQGAVGTPDELASAISFLASDEASFINGTTLVVDGGRLDIL